MAVVVLLRRLALGSIAVGVLLRRVAIRVLLARLRRLLRLALRSIAVRLRRHGLLALLRLALLRRGLLLRLVFVLLGSFAHYFPWYTSGFKMPM